MNQTRPTLDKQISPDEFRSFYWLKEELMAFCRGHGLSPTRSKQEISARIAHYLETGEALTPEKRSRPRPRRRGPAAEPLGLETVITTGYTNSEANRAFFQSVIGPSFHFTTNFMRFCRENVGKTYREAVAEWHAEQERRQEKGHKTEIGAQFQYNQFIRDFMADNPGNPIAAALTAWKERKGRRGSLKYSREEAEC